MADTLSAHRVPTLLELAAGGGSIGTVASGATLGPSVADDRSQPTALGPSVADDSGQPTTLGPSVADDGPPCWVARAAFGEEDFRWQIFRAWLMEDAPAWFSAAYLRYGPTLGAWLEGRNLARSMVRRAMMVAIRRKLG